MTISKELLDELLSGVNFTPVHERGTKWENIEEHIPTILRQAPLIGFMNLAPLKAAYDCHCT
jgi:hypothetical protein